MCLDYLFQLHTQQDVLLRLQQMKAECSTRHDAGNDSSGLWMPYPASCRSVAQCSCLSFPPSATVPPIQNVEDRFVMCQPCPLLNSHDPPGIPLKPNLVPVSNMNPCPSNRCHKWTTASVLSDFCAGKEGICLDMQMAAGACAALTTVRQTKGFLLWCHQQATSTFKACLIWNLQDFLWTDLSSRMALFEPRHPVLWRP